MTRDGKYDEAATLKDQFFNRIFDLGQYFNALEEHIDRSEENEVNLLAQEAKEEGREYDPDYWDEHYPWEWETVFFHHLRSSAVISTFSIIEYNLECAWVWAEKNLQIEVPQSHPDRPSKIKKFQRQFSEQAGLTTDPSPAVWDLLDAHYKVRNAFVHNGGEFCKCRNQRTLNEHINSVEGVTLNHGFIMLSSYYWSDFHDLSKGFVTHLWCSLIERLKQTSA